MLGRKLFTCSVSILRLVHSHESGLSDSGRPPGCTILSIFPCCLGWHMFIYVGRINCAVEYANLSFCLQIQQILILFIIAAAIFHQGLPE